MSKRYGTLADRFHGQYIPEPNSGCWLWTGNYKQADLPYGRLKIPDSKRTVFAHRVSYELHHGITLGRSDFICHRCDNPCCVNPEHLFLGDKYSNMADRDQKQRQKRGSDHANSKLTEETVLQIILSEEPTEELAKRFGVTAGAVYCVRTGKTWKHVKAA